ncbi:hypothetical protein M0811_00398 [Anaeramoeba ignava]|uniref:Uncharacterized protein n=1 Tax=Anaeramoeba ignava TaxID=1746090 RepID=A0A9Q0LTC8_ANAIG|nr:hypothetical protein M0811_00398 [Anaeramoeba ignava]
MNCLHQNDSSQDFVNNDEGINGRNPFDPDVEYFNQEIFPNFGIIGIIGIDKLDNPNESIVQLESVHPLTETKYSTFPANKFLFIIILYIFILIEVKLIKFDQFF